jgi:hypothetical protein
MAKWVMLAGESNRVGTVGNLENNLMSLWLKILLGFIAVIVIVVNVLMAYLWVIFPDFSPTYSVLPLVSETSGDTVYLKSKVWGIPDSKRIVVISASPNEEFEPDRTIHYIYRGWKALFYQLEGDTLTVYVNIAKADPPNFVSGITVRQVEMSRSEEIKLEQEYKERGLSVFP